MTKKLKAWVDQMPSGYAAVIFSPTGMHLALPIPEDEEAEVDPDSTTMRATVSAMIHHESAEKLKARVMELIRVGYQDYLAEQRGMH